MSRLARAAAASGLAVLLAAVPARTAERAARPGAADTVLLGGRILILDAKSGASLAS